MSDEHRSADDTAPHALPREEERRLARKALAGRARDSDDLSLLTDMLDLDPGRDALHDAAQGQEPAGHRPGTGRTVRERRHDTRRDTCRDARSRSADPR